MRLTLLNHLMCPECSGPLEGRYDQEEDGHVISGSLVCSSCARSYAIRGGVPRMNAAMTGLEQVAESFSYEWKAHHDGKLERDTLFGLTLEEDWAYFRLGTGLSDADLIGKVVLDGGCGSGRPTRQMAEHGASVVIGVDMNDAVDEAFRAARDLQNVHIVQGNIFALPFQHGQFDLVWSNGVIHHTPDAERGHRELAKRVKPGGLLYVYVYPKRFNPFRFTKDVLIKLKVTRLPQPVLFRLSKALSYPSLVMLWTYQAIRSLPGLRPRGAWARRTVRRRTLRELHLTWFDVLAPEYDTRHTEEEVKEWFSRAGFVDVSAIEEPKVGVRGRAPG